MITVGDASPTSRSTSRWSVRSGQRRGGFALGGGAEVGGDHAVAVVDQAAHGLRSDQPETACDKNLLGHLPPVRGSSAATGCAARCCGYDILIN
jgi:hypothetical protein